MKVKNKKCQNKGCENTFTPFKTTDKYCSFSCAKSNQKSQKKVYTPIKKKSDKRKKQEAIYLKKRADFLNKKENKKCPVFPNLPTTDVHHKKGRVGFADAWARHNGINLYLDERFWLAVSRKGHQKIENNPIWAKEKGFSLDRLTSE